VATIRKQIDLGAPADQVWDALRDFQAVHTRLVPGFVVDSVPDGDGARVVTFFNGVVTREVLVGIDDDARRLAYHIPDGLPGCTHHGASAEVIDRGDGCTFVWITDVLPDELGGAIEPMMARGAEVLEETLDSLAAVDGR
jgi:carbon monoxide dehydrogenase subunit G